MKPATRSLILLGSCAALLCALLAWRLVGHPPASPSRADPTAPHATAAHSAAVAHPVASSALIASASTSADRLELERRCLHLAETDPLAAMDRAIAQKLTVDDPGLLNALILRWADQDFSGALQWTLAQPRDAGRDDLLAHLAFLRSREYPAAAVEIASSEIVSPRARAEAILSVVHQWAGQNPAAAQAWSARLADADLRRRALDDIAATQAQGRSALALSAR